MQYSSYLNFSVPKQTDTSTSTKQNQAHNKVVQVLNNCEPHRVELNTASERELEHPDSCKITSPEPSQPSRLDGRCKAQPDNARSRCRNNDGSCKVK